MMQQDRGRRGSSDRQGMKQDNQQQDQTLKAPTVVEDQQQKQPHQKCPRCDSLNTKFCYYNNYSLSQPRYLCKTCRRYWTQGGTLRNVPFRGGCRKGKRTKISSYSSGEGSRSTQTPQVLPQQATHPPLSMTMISSNHMTTMSSAFKTKEFDGLATPSNIPSIEPYYHDDVFLSSLPAIRSMNQPQSQPFNQPYLGQALNIGGGSSNLSHLQGYGMPSFGSQHHHLDQRTQFVPTDDRDQKSIVNMYRSYPQERFSMSSRLDACDSSRQNWHHQGFINNNDLVVSETAMRNINNNNNNNTSSVDKTDTNNTTGGSLNPNQWFG